MKAYNFASLKQFSVEIENDNENFIDNSIQKL